MTQKNSIIYKIVMDFGIRHDIYKSLCEIL